MIKIEPIDKEMVIKHRLDQMSDVLIKMLNDIILDNCKIYSTTTVKRKYLNEKCSEHGMTIEDLFNFNCELYYIYKKQGIRVEFFNDVKEIRISLFYD